MAILQDNAGSGKQFHLFDLGENAPTPPKGTFAATIIDIKDEFGVERRKFDNPNETEKVDLTAFLFGFRDRAGSPFKIDSRPMKISGNEKANLMLFLKSLLGETPKMGWDYMELKGRKCLITVEHVLSKDGTRAFPQIAAVSPLPEGFDAASAAAPAAQVQRPAPAAPRMAQPAPRPAAPAPLPQPPPVAVEADNDDPLPF